MLRASRTIAKWPRTLTLLSSYRTLYEANGRFGIMREVYSKWERRAPLTPDQLKMIIGQGYEAVVQPSNRRIFRDEEYRRAGAVISDDLSSCSTILGVKQVPVDSLLPERTYMFFSHTIKAQPENMALLDALLAKKIRMIDYECITDTGERSGRRLVAFGRFAGIAGMVDVLNGLGRQLLAKGYSTPFVHCPTTYMYSDLSMVRAGIEALGRQIHTVGLPTSLCPLVFGFTGRGKVSQGAQEVLNLLPVDWVSPSDLPGLMESFRSGGMRNVCRTLYACVIEEDAMVERVKGGGYDRKEYRDRPENYRPIFHSVVAPYLSVLVNGMYWDARYPRLLSRSQLKEMVIEDKSRLLAVADISCDVDGSLEFLVRTCDIEKPFFMYRPLTGQVDDDVDGNGVLVSGVDILPSELPREATQAFGDALLPLLPSLLSSKGHDAAADPDSMCSDLQAALQGAVITAGGRLTTNFNYISFLRAEKEREKRLSDRIHRQTQAPLAEATIKLTGHLFDTGLINQVLDLIESRGGSFVISECIVRPNKGHAKHTSTVVLHIEGQTREVVGNIVTRLRQLVELVEAAEATVSEISTNGNGGISTPAPSDASHAATVSSADARVTSHTPQRVLVLGAGRVAGPAVEYLGRDPRRHLTVVGATGTETSLVANRAKWTRALQLDVSGERHAVRTLISQADVVVSLLPATMHVAVAQDCLELERHCVTSSYVSDAMRELHGPAAEKGLVFLNEAGLDPGMDHLSATRLIDGAKDKGGKVISYRSVCGGLPAPEAAATNPFCYKFSWSPRAVLSAAQQPATFLENGRKVTVGADQLLTSAAPAPDVWPSLRLEVLPNRNSLVYADLYGIQDAHTVFRGTLRYQGWSQLMHGCQVLGLFDDVPVGEGEWPAVMAKLLGVHGDEAGTLEQVAAQRVNDRGISGASRVVEALRWLGLFGGGNSSGASVKGTSVIDAFCAVLEDRLTFAPGERDMVLMRHDIVVSYDSDTEERLVSKLLVYGDERDSAMARTVGTTCGMATELVLEGAVRQKGVVTPMTRDIYDPLLDRLSREGMCFDESHTSVPSSGPRGRGAKQAAM